MKTFELHLPRTIDEALALLERPGHAALAGGQDLLTELKEHIATPDALVDLSGIQGADAIELRADGSLSIGAGVTLAELEKHAELARRWPVLTEAATSIASAQIRSQATVGGNLCQRPRCWYYRNEALSCLKKGGTECLAYGGMNKYNAILGGGPSYIVHPSDLAPALVALDAEIEIASREPRGARRRIALASFFTLPAEGDVLRENVLAPGELVVAVHVPAHAAGNWRSTYLKFKERSSFDWALSAVALVARIDGARIAEARVVLGGVAPVPWRSKAAERVLAGRPIDDSAAREAGEAALAGAEPLSGNAYKVPLTKGLIVKALRAIGGRS
ncbi:MAG: xanthine dehydrogenase family protein subunit M [Planctomycetes bacterium]|nr:xanthine dehydrogenase family protein subunit M [Planctomycetota bacterium]